MYFACFIYIIPFPSHTHLSENSKRAVGLLCAYYASGIVVEFG